MSISTSKNINITVGLIKTGTTYRRNFFKQLKNVQYIEKPMLYQKLDETKKIIISNPSFAGTPFLHYEINVENRYKNLERLKTFFPNARIILCLRKKENMLRSLYSQYAENGGTKNFDDFLCSELDMSWFDYAAYIVALKNNFRDVFVFNFEEFKQRPLSMMENICVFMDVEPPCFSDAEALNKKWTSSQIHLSHFLNKFWKSPRYYIDHYLVG